MISKIELLPKDEKPVRAGFYLCNSIFEIMEEAYLDLELEKEFGHPDNRGWMNLFKHWAWSPMVRVAWTISASNYGARFQSFCQRHLNLTIGKAGVEKLGLKPEKSEYKDIPEARAIGREIVCTVGGWLATVSDHPEVLSAATARVNGITGKAPRKPDKKADDVLAAARSLIDEAIRQRPEGAIIRPSESSISGDEHQDSEWYAAAALLEMLWRGVDDEKVLHKTAGDVAEFALLHAA